MSTLSKPFSKGAGGSKTNREQRMGYIKNHWNGDQPLVQAFWVNNVLLGLALYVILEIVGTPIALDMGKSGDVIVGVIFFLVWLVFAIAISVWMIVGVWRSAEAYKDQKLDDGRSGAWGTVAQVLMVLAAIWLCINGIGLIIGISQFLG